jgi:tetratricopeptide (TPR) repeat protein
LIRGAFETNLRLFGEEDHRTLFWMDFLGTTLVQEGQTEEGTDLMRRSVAGLRRVHGNNLMTAYAMERLAHIENSLGDQDTAVSLRLESIDIVRKVHGENHPYTLEKYSQLARVLLYMDPERLDEAEHFARRAMVEPGSPRRPDQLKFVPWMCNTLALILEKQGKQEEALATFEEGEIVAREAWGDDVWFRQISVANYGHALTESRQFERAEDLLLSALEAFGRPDSKHHNRDRARNVRQALADLYDAWDKPEKTAEYRALLEEVPATQGPD